MTEQKPQAGWYTDPADDTQRRYWDGSGWTQHRAPRFAAPSPPAPAPVEAPGNGLSGGAIVCGLIALAIFPPLFGVVGILLAAFGAGRKEPLATIGFAAAITGMIVGMMLGYLVAGSLTGQV